MRGMYVAVTVVNTTEAGRGKALVAFNIPAICCLIIEMFKRLISPVVLFMAIAM